MIGLTAFQQHAFDIIRQHSKAKPVTGKDIANLIGLKARDTGKEGADLRSVINALRVKGYPICATGEGYYYPRTSEELSAFISSFQGRIDKQQEAANGMKKGFDKIGQSAAPVQATNCKCSCHLPDNKTVAPCHFCLNYDHCSAGKIIKEVSNQRSLL